MAIEPFDYVVDGKRYKGMLADGSAGGCVPGILVAHEAFGIGRNILERIEALAEAGLVALALDLYGEDAPSEHQIAEQHQYLMSTPGLICRRAGVALDLLAALPQVDASRLGAVGFCQGGITVMELARAAAPICCAVGFHPGLKRPAGSQDCRIAAHVLMLLGEIDPVVPPADRDAFIAEMKSKAVDWQLHLFGNVGHAFTNRDVDLLKRPGFAFDDIAARRSWKLMLQLFEEVF